MTEILDREAKLRELADFVSAKISEKTPLFQTISNKTGWLLVPDRDLVRILQDLGVSIIMELVPVGDMNKSATLKMKRLTTVYGTTVHEILEEIEPLLTVSAVSALRRGGYQPIEVTLAEVFPDGLPKTINGNAPDNQNEEL